MNNKTPTPQGDEVSTEDIIKDIEMIRNSNMGLCVMAMNNIDPQEDRVLFLTRQLIIVGDALREQAQKLKVAEDRLEEIEKAKARLERAFVTFNKDPKSCMENGQCVSDMAYEEAEKQNQKLSTEVERLKVSVEEWKEDGGEKYSEGFTDGEAHAKLNPQPENEERG